MQLTIVDHRPPKQISKRLAFDHYSATVAVHDRSADNRSNKAQAGELLQIEPPIARTAIIDK
jgi:hypothetical protein